MAKRRFRGRIAIQKDRIQIVHPATEPVIQRCPVCRSDSWMAIPEEAARRRGLTVRTIYRWMEAGAAHFLEIPGGVLVCLKSLEPQNPGGNT